MLLILLLLIGLPLIEIYFLIQVGSEIGALPTIGLTILTAVLGAGLVRHQGFGVLQRIRDMQERDELPALEILDGALLLVAGFFLLLPGFLTDSLGFLLLIPPLRHWTIKRYLIGRHFGMMSVSRRSPAGQRHAPRTIEGDYRRDD